MQPANFKTLTDAIVQIAIFWGGFWAALKATKEYFQVRVAEADRKSFAKIVDVILKDIQDLRKCNEQGANNEREMRVLIDRLIDDLRFIMNQIMESAFPKQLNKDKE